MKRRSTSCLGLRLALSQLLFCVCCIGNTFKVYNAYDLINVSNAVNSGNENTKIAILLEADIDFTEVTDNFDPIGNGTKFTGMFDGKGHIISGLRVNSSCDLVGLFGSALGATIKNVILDESCSFESYFKNTENYLGSVIGLCKTGDVGCSIESIVNMGKVTLHESSGNSMVGGICGSISGSNGNIANCINYGEVAFRKGNSNRVGGIVGHFYSNAVFNCLNYGIIKGSATSGNSIGGIAGSILESEIINCISLGKTMTNKADTGAITGDGQTGSSIIHCFWTASVGCNKPVKDEEQKSCVIRNSTLTELNQTTVDLINRYALDNGMETWNSWLLNLDNKTFSFNFNNNNRSFKLDSQLIPILRLTEDDNYTFNGWFTDNILTNNFGTESTETTLYSSYGLLHTLGFIANDGSNAVNSVQAEGSMIAFPGESFYAKVGHTFDRWDPNNTVVPDENITFTAKYIRNNYTVTFDFGNGTNATYTFGYNDTIVYPNVSKREGYVFGGWDSNATIMEDSNLTIKGLWEETSEYVEIVFSGVDVTKQDVKDIIKKYTQDEFVIKKFGSDESKGETMVIVKFHDKTSAENFVEIIKETYDSTSTVSIRKVGYIQDPVLSFSPTIIFLLDLLFLIF